MDCLLNLFVWIRKNIVRFFVREYPNFLLKDSILKERYNNHSINLVSSTDNFWVSRSMFMKWENYKYKKNINLNIYSNKQVNKFMKEKYQNDLIYEIYLKSVLPVQKIDIFRICFIYLYGGIWLDLKSEINLNKVMNLYDESEKKGVLLCEPRKIEVVSYKGKKQNITKEKVIHNGFFCLPKRSLYLEQILFNIKKDYIYFQDILFKYPKQGIMNLTGPHQFTRSFFQINDFEKPLLASQEDIDWIYFSKYGEFLSPLMTKKHYSALTESKTIDSNKKSDLP